MTPKPTAIERGSVTADPEQAKRGALLQRLPWVMVGVLGISVIVLMVINGARLVPYAIVWGDIATWAQAVLTGGALVFAGVSVLFAARQLERSRQMERSRAAEVRDVARRGLVLRSLWTPRTYLPKASGLLTYEYECANMSAFPVTNCKIMLHMWGDENDRFYDSKNAKSADDFYQAVVIGALAPGEVASGTVTISNPDAAIGMWGMERVANPDLTFTDAWGEHWLRRGTTHARELVDDTREEYPQCMCCGYLPDARGRGGAFAQRE